MIVAGTIKIRTANHQRTQSTKTCPAVRPGALGMVKAIGINVGFAGVPLRLFYHFLDFTDIIISLFSYDSSLYRIFSCISDTLIVTSSRTH